MYFFCFLLLEAVELDTKPVWESNDFDYSTGGILVDVDSDGDLDLVTGNGNDMARNQNRVYYNGSNMLETDASWSSNDAACNGHISMGDIDSDGDLDLAAAGFAFHIGWQSDPSRVYKNEGSAFETDPVWLGGDTLQAFSCDWGDADGDGDLDLAVAAGNDYVDKLQKVVIFENEGGSLSAEPMWESEDSDFNMDVCWVDVNGDGNLDLAAGGYAHNRVYFMEEGILNTHPGWISGDAHHTVQIAFGDFDRDGDMDMAAADNNQIGDDQSKIRLYINQNGQLDTLPSWESKLWTYQSCVTWGDADGDGDLDLAAGGWWEPVTVYENKNGNFDTSPNWTWSPSSPMDLVCEQVVWGEMDNNNWKEITESFGNAVSGHVVYPSHFPALDIIEVKIDGITVTPVDYKWNPVDGWIQTNEDGILEVTYRYSQFPDLLVTNWDMATGNFLFLNLSADTTNSLAEMPAKNPLSLALVKTVIQRGECPRIVTQEPVVIKTATLYEVTGRRIEMLKIGQTISTLDLDIETSTLTSGMYLLVISTETDKVVLKFQLL